MYTYMYMDVDMFMYMAMEFLFEVLFASDVTAAYLLQSLLETSVRRLSRFPLFALR